MHNYLRYEPMAPDAMSRFWTGPLCRLLNHVWANDLFLEYFGKGKFHWSIPGACNISHQEAEPPPLDWLGLNYYSRCILADRLSSACL